MSNNPPEHSLKSHDWKKPLYLFSLVILIVSIFWIYQSPYLSSYSSDQGILLSLLGVAASLFMSMHAFNYYIGFAIIALFAIASILLNMGNDDYAKIGTWILVIAAIAPAVYLIYDGRWGNKYASKESLYVSVIAGLIAAVLLVLSLTNIL